MEIAEQNLAELLSFLDRTQYGYPADEALTAKLADEDDPNGLVHLVNREGHIYAVMPRETYEALCEYRPNGLPDRALWTLAQAKVIIESIRPWLRDMGFAIGLTGSVLHEGHSDKDLDLIIYPLDTNKADRTLAQQALFRSGLVQRADRVSVARAWKDLGSNDTKHVEVWRDPKGRRIDIFFLQ